MNNGDRNIVSNLRHRWSEELKKFTDEQIAEDYRDFSQSDYYGDNDARFLEWMGLIDG